MSQVYKITRVYTDNRLLNQKNKKAKIMGNLLYIIAVILVIGWAIGFLGVGYHGGIIHILLVIAVIAVIFRVIQGRSI